MTAESSDLERAYAAAMRLLTFRFRSEKELRERLQRREFEATVIEETMDRLRAERWLDDRRFAESYARTRLRRKLGRRRIERELREHGISDAEASAAIAVATEDEPEEEHLRELCRKKMRILSRRFGSDFLEDSEGRKKLLSYLLSQGYEASAAIGAIDGELRPRRG